MIEFIDEHKIAWGVEPICRVLPIAPSTYYAAKKGAPAPRTRHDEQLKFEIRRVYDANFKVYGADKIWVALNRENIKVALRAVDAPDGHPGCPQSRQAPHQDPPRRPHRSSRRPR